MVAHKQKFHDIVAKPTTSRSQSGYVNFVDADIWELRGRQINFNQLADAVTVRFLKEIKSQFAFLLNAQRHADSTLRAYFAALKDCLHFAFRGTGRKVDALTSAMVVEWCEEIAVVVDYPYFLKLFVIGVRHNDPKAFPLVTNKTLNALTKPKTDVQDVLSLDPKKGPWLEQEVLDQDLAIEQAYTSGTWHAERYIFIQLFRAYGMRPEQLANMKIEDVKCRATGHAKGEIRWPYAKNDIAAAQALWWPLGGALLEAMETYVTLRLHGVLANERERQPLFTPEGLPGTWHKGRVWKANREPGYEGHLLATLVSQRFIVSMKSLGLKTERSGYPEPMHFNPRRERHTVGTRLALKGYSARQIALRLGHKSDNSCTSYVDLARMVMQMRNPKFYHLMDDVGSVFINPVVSRAEIEETLMPVISVEATTVEGIALIGGGSCGNCMFSGDAATGEPWPCLSCPRFQLYEDADLLPLWDILQERQAYMEHEDGSWNSRFDPDIRAQFDRYKALLIGAERRRRAVTAERASIEQGEEQ